MHSFIYAARCMALHLSFHFLCLVLYLSITSYDICSSVNTIFVSDSLVCDWLLVHHQFGWGVAQRELVTSLLVLGIR